MADVGGILLVGGTSTRMGHPKAELDWHGTPLAAHLAGVLRDAFPTAPLVVVAAPGQTLPTLPDGVEVVTDSVAGEGPLRGLATGLQALSGHVDVACACAVDTPLLTAAVLRALAAGMRPDDAALVPVAHEHRHPLTACYRLQTLATAEAMLARGERALGRFAEEIGARFIDEAALRALPLPDDPDRTLADRDPDLDALRNANTPEEFAELLRRT